MLVFEESLGWGQGDVHFSNAIFGDEQEEQTRLMVRNSINHPCVIMWGFLNEGWSQHPSSDGLYPRLIQALREEDSSRLVTYASNHPLEDRHFDKIDVISINMYPGWYECDEDTFRPLDRIEPRIDKVIAHIADKGLSAKPSIISEIGAGAIYGWRDALAALWSEEYQADYLDIVCRRVVADCRIAGISIWQYCDGRTYANGGALGRPRAFNNKGTLDEYRRPKMAYARVKARFSGE